MAYCGEKLAPNKRPRAVEFRDELSKSTVGKSCGGIWSRRRPDRWSLTEIRRPPDVSPGGRYGSIRQA